MITDRDPQSMSEAERLVEDDDWADFVDSLTPNQRRMLLYRWSFWRRPSQEVPEGVGYLFRVWMVRAGRGYGKTRTGAETTREQVEIRKRIAIIGATAADARDVMIEGESGIMSVFPKHQRPDYEPSKRRIRFHTGCLATVYSAEEPDRLRGPQQEWAWGDEPASWKYGKDAMDNLMLGLRLGDGPWAMLTGTPKPTQWLRDLTAKDDCVTTTGSTYENAHNLAPSFITDILGRFEGTRLGRQELHAEWLDDVEGALWTQQIINAGRLSTWDVRNPWRSLNEWLIGHGRVALLDRRPWRIIVAVDPPGTTAECGIMVGTAPQSGVAGRDHAVVLDDMSMPGRPEEWGAQVCAAYHKWHAEAVYVEKNMGGDMCRATIHAVDPTVTVRAITAKESKSARSEPIAALDEKGWVHHAGFLGGVESQMVTWVPGSKGPEGKSPDRIDARTHLIRELLTVFPVAPARVVNPNRRGRRIPQ